MASVTAMRAASANLAAALREMANTNKPTTNPLKGKHYRSDDHLVYADYSRLDAAHREAGATVSGRILDTCRSLMEANGYKRSKHGEAAFRSDVINVLLVMAEAAEKDEVLWADWPVEGKAAMGPVYNLIPPKGDAPRTVSIGTTAGKTVSEVWLCWMKDGKLRDNPAEVGARAKVLREKAKRPTPDQVLLKSVRKAVGLPDDMALTPELVGALSGLIEKAIADAGIPDVVAETIRTAEAS